MSVSALTSAASSGLPQPNREEPPISSTNPPSATTTEAAAAVPTGGEVSSATSFLEKVVTLDVDIQAETQKWKEHRKVTEVQRQQAEAALRQEEEWAEAQARELTVLWQQQASYREFCLQRWFTDTVAAMWEDMLWSQVVREDSTRSFWERLERIERKRIQRAMRGATFVTQREEFGSAETHARGRVTYYEQDGWEEILFLAQTSRKDVLDRLKAFTDLEEIVTKEASSFQTTYKTSAVRKSLCHQSLDTVSHEERFEREILEVTQATSIQDAIRWYNQQTTYLQQLRRLRRRTFKVEQAEDVARQQIEGEQGVAWEERKKVIEEKKQGLVQFGLEKVEVEEYYDRHVRWIAMEYQAREALSWQYQQELQRLTKGRLAARQFVVCEELLWVEETERVDLVTAEFDTWERLMQQFEREGKEASELHMSSF